MRGRSKTAIALLLTLTLAFTTTVYTINPVSAQTTNVIRCTGTIGRPNAEIGMYAISWNFHEYDANTISLAFAASQSDWVSPNDTANQYAAKINQFHALNPNYKALLYINSICVYNYTVNDWSTANSNGWLLKDANGNYVVSKTWPENYRVDITNSGYQTWFADKIHAWFVQYPSFDGVMVDNGLVGSLSNWADGASARPINPQTGTYFTWDQIKTAYIELLNKITTAVGPEKLVVPNGIWSGSAFYQYRSSYTDILSQTPQLNGLMSEATFASYNGEWYSQTDWLNSINFVNWLQSDFLKDHSDRIFIATCQTADLPPGATAEQVIKYGYCSMLLATDYPSPQNVLSLALNATGYQNNLHLIQQLQNTRIGVATSAYYQINSTNVYARDFSLGEVLVNPTNTPYTVTFTENLSTIDGTLVSGAFAVLPHSGIILIK
jgi:hypothetical protein